MTINKLGKVTIYVEDQSAAKEFWCEKLGYVVAFEAEMAPGMTWLEVAPRMESETTFVLYNKASYAAMGREPNHPGVILSTKDIEASYAKMQEVGIEVGELQKMPYGTMFNFKDQDGNDYLLREDK